MKAFLATTCIVTGAMLAGGCATKKYVQNTAAPIQAKVDQVGEQTSRNGTKSKRLATRSNRLTRRRRAVSARRRNVRPLPISTLQPQTSMRGEAMNCADQANKLGEKNTQDLNRARGASSLTSTITSYRRPSRFRSPSISTN